MFRSLVPASIAGVLAAFVCSGCGEVGGAKPETGKEQSLPAPGARSSSGSKFGEIVVEAPFVSTFVVKKRAASSDPGVTELRSKAAPLVAKLRRLSERKVTPWAQMHLLLTCGPHARTPTDVVEPLRQSIFTPEADEAFWQVRGKQLVASSGTGKRFTCQKHRDQFLSYLGMAGVAPNAPVRIDETDYTVRDLVLQSLYDVREEGELEWSVMAFANYVDPNATWKNKFDEELSVARLTEALLGRTSAPCGGTHRLTGLTVGLLAMHDRPTKETSGVRQRVHEELEREYGELRSRQTADGSIPWPNLRSNGVGDALSDLHPLYYTGHSLEWLALWLPAEDLRSDFVTKALRYVMEASEQEVERIESGTRGKGNPEDLEMSLGILGHAGSAIALWLSRTGVEPPGPR